MDTKTTVIGYGNPLMGDDGVAHIVLDELERLLGVPDIEIVRRHQLDVVDAEAISKSHAVVFVDAHVSERLGDVEMREITGAQKDSINVTHISSPEELIVMAREIYGATPRAFVCAVRGYDFSFGAQLTEPAQKLARCAAEELCRLIETLR
ncbi:MAG: hydrogenase maturation protease [Candidatus Aquicultor sp.]